MKNLVGKTALVTGASRGVGRGIALGLGEAGATVFITGRPYPDNSNRHALLQEIADAVSDQGGKGIPIHCDHRNDDDVKSLFSKISDNSDKLNILVNNVWGGYEYMFNDSGDYTWEKPFWDQPVELWDSMFSSGVRAHYVSSICAAKLMISGNSGMIINISYWAAQKYIGNVVYGVSKAATDKMTADMSVELKPYNIPVISLYPGIVRTERVMESAEFLDLSNSESPQFTGRVISKMAGDPKIMEKTGSVQVVARLAREYHVRDIDGKQPKPLTLNDL